MATVRAYASLDLINEDLLSGPTESATSNGVVVSDGLFSAEYLGFGFRYSSTSVIDGTMTAINFDRNGTLFYEVSDFSAPADIAFDSIDANDAQGLFSLVLRADDTIFGSNADDVLAGYSGNDDIIAKEGNDTVFGGSGNDVINAGAGANHIDGGSGFDVEVYDGRLRDHTIDFSGGSILVDSLSASDELVGIERLTFTDATIAFDEIAAIGYRLYQAAFDRTPDVGGLSYWVDRLDDGLSLTTMAANFIDSAEFRGLYGSQPSEADFISLLYENVLNRQPDNGGYDYWLGRFDDGLSRADMLAQFSDSTENRANVAPDIADGIQLDYGVFA